MIIDPTTQFGRFSTAALLDFLTRLAKRGLGNKLQRKVESYGQKHRCVKSPSTGMKSGMRSNGDSA